MTEPRDIGDRLTNWAEWCLGVTSRGPACMTGAICEKLRKEAEGSQWDGVERRHVDEADAVLIGRAIVRIHMDFRRLLGLHYIDKARPGYIAAMLRFHPREYEGRLAAAQKAIETAAIERRKAEQRK